MNFNIYTRAAVFIGFSVSLSALLVSFDAFEAAFQFSRAHESWELDDLILSVISTMIAGSLWLSTEVYLKIAKVRQTAKALQEKDRELEQIKRQRSINTLASGLAHSGNNMLQPILTLSRISLKQLSNDHPVRSNLERITTVAEQAADLFRAVDSFSREHIHTNDTTDVSKVLKNNKNIFSVSVPSTAHLDIQVNCDSANIDLNLPEFTDVLLVFLSNAVDSLDGQTGQITVSLDAVADFVVLTVSDTGHGMTPDVREHIMEPFFTTKKVGSGTGLGLHIVRSLMDRVGGNVTVESEPGRGSRFTLYFPRIAELDTQTSHVQD